MRVIALLTCCLLATSAHAQTNRSSNYIQSSQQARQDYVNTRQLETLRTQGEQIIELQKSQQLQVNTLQTIQQQQAEMIQLQRETNELLRLQIQQASAN